MPALPDSGVRMGSRMPKCEWCTSRASSGTASVEEMPPSPRDVTLTEWSMISMGLICMGVAVRADVVTNEWMDFVNGDAGMMSLIFGSSPALRRRIFTLRDTSGEACFLMRSFMNDSTVWIVLNAVESRSSCFSLSL